jgi:hypothetical protein
MFKIGLLMKLSFFNSYIVSFDISNIKFICRKMILRYNRFVYLFFLSHTRPHFCLFNQILIPIYLLRFGAYILSFSLVIECYLLLSRNCINTWFSSCRWWTSGCIAIGSVVICTHLLMYLIIYYKNKVITSLTTF